MNGRDQHQLLNWCELLLEDRLDEQSSRQFEQLVIADPQARQLYLDYITLHGMLAWDAAGAGLPFDDASEPAASASPAEAIPATVASRNDEAVNNRLVVTAIAAAVVVLAATVAFQFAPPMGGGDPAHNNLPVAGDPGDGSDSTLIADDDNRSIPSIALPEDSRTGHENTPAAAVVENVASPDPNVVVVTAADPPVTKQVVESIDNHMAVIWEDYEVEQSAVADDAEWLRRSYLDLVGHIPPADVVTAFVDDHSIDKRSRMIDELLVSAGHTRHLSTVWTNLLIGRRPRPQADRDGLAKFLREQFHANRPWRDTVSEMLTAEGRGDENLASNFLLAHLNNEAVPATAVACRLFLGQQMLCAQCHKHPEQGWDQQRFWQLNACFQQTDVVPSQAYDSQTGTMVTVGWELQDEPVSGPTYYDDMRGVRQAAYPGLDETLIDDGEETNRREELMRLMLTDDQHQLAAAFVNRTWADFFGYALVNPVDDLGPHTSSIHSDLLNELAAAFVDSDYDVRELQRWICLSRPYQLSSRFSESNDIDDPAAGEPPLFSRMYLRSFTPEQLFDSLVVATSAGESGSSDWNEVEAQRRAWSQAFYQSAETDDNSELSTFEDSYSQALVLMNGDMVLSAVAYEPGSLLFEVMTEESTDARLERLWLSTLSRRPTDTELDRSRRLVQQSVRQQTVQGEPIQLAQANTMGDVLWALLNSSEFSVNY